MNIRYALGVFAVCILTTPLFAMAAPGTFCNALPVRAISVGSRGDDVRTLQSFLSSEGYFTSSATGYFGPITRVALARWQVSQGVPGVGVVGPQTRAMFARRCTDRQPTNPTPFTPSAMCKAWSDGCNDCSRTVPGGIAACTERACFAAGQGYCKEYFGSSPTPTPVACTMEYAPVCGRPSGCANTCPSGAVCAAICQLYPAQTYGNRCALNTSGAQLLHEGECTASD